VNLHTSDLLAFYGEDWLSRLIRWRTMSWTQRPHLGPSHVGTIGFVEDESRKNGSRRFAPALFESTSRNDSPCLLRKVRFAGLQVQPVNARIRQYIEAGGTVELYRLKKDLDWNEVLTLNVHMQEWIGKELPYDFAGALGSSRWFDILGRFFKPNLDELFCSESCAAFDQFICRLPQKADPADYSPARLIRAHLSQGSRYLAATASTLTPDGEPIWREA